MGYTALRKIQIGKESTKGTPVAATAMLRGMLSIDDNWTQHKPDEHLGSLIVPRRSVKVAQDVGLSFDGDATFEQLLYFLSMGVKGNITPTGAGSEKTWTFTPAKSAAGTFDSFTIEAGDDVQAVEAEYCMASKIAISGGMSAACKVKADMFGRQITNTTFTAALAPPDVETILGQQAKLYIDDEDGTIGSTEKANSLIDWTYTIDTGLYAKRYGNGYLYFAAYGEKGAKATLQVTAAFNSGVNAERANMDGEKQRLVRVEATGSTIDALPKKLSLDICGVYVPNSFKLLDERDGEDIVTFTIESMDSENYGKGFEIAVVNALSTLP